MKLKIELQRIGSSRVSYDSIPIMARVMGGSKPDSNLLDGAQFRDLECAKQAVQDQLDQRFGRAVEIEWVDRTGERI